MKHLVRCDTQQLCNSTRNTTHGPSNTLEIATSTWPTYISKSHFKKPSNLTPIPTYLHSRNGKEIRKEIAWKTIGRMPAFRPNASSQVKCQQQLHAPPPHTHHTLHQFRPCQPQIGSMRIQQMGTYRAGLTIWHSTKHSAISFSIGRLRRNHMPIAAFLHSHWLLRILLILLRLRLLLRLHHGLRFPFSAHYSIASFDNSLFRHLRTSPWSFTGSDAWRTA